MPDEASSWRPDAFQPDPSRSDASRSDASPSQASPSDRSASDAPPSADDRLGDLVARYVEVYEARGEGAAEALLGAAPDLTPDLVAAVREQLARLRAAGLLAAAAPPPRIGHYTVLERLGAGGMGDVYLAEQRQPVRRRVALKVIKLGLASRDVVARFEVERQALALMSHANIARVLDAGATEEGQPYFAMEYVPGLPLTAYCDARRLETRARLELMVCVCDAVQHAHYKGIIHRDLKPSNVLVMEQDGRAVPKIIDFGVAKAVAVGIGNGSVFTAHGMVVGTPEYMSPEQAGRGELDVDTRTDVYSLGVMLYELLTGGLPFSSERLRGRGLEQMLSIIRDEPPERPSTRVSGQRPDTARLAEVRSTDAVSLYRHLRGDLDWVVLKALEKDRNRRYPTPALLAEDLRRCLADEPVGARPPSLGYRTAKFVRRNKLAVALAAATVLALLAGLGVSFAFYRRAAANAVAAGVARDEAEAARAVAERNFDSAMQAVDDLLSRVGESSLEHVPHMSGVRRDLLQRALRFYEGFAAQRSRDPRVRFELAVAQDRVGRIDQMLGEHAAAKQAYATALATFDALLAERPDHPGAAERRAGVQCHLAHVLKASGAPGARDLATDALATLRRLDSGAMPPPGSSSEPSRTRHLLIAEAAVLLAELDAERDPKSALARSHEALRELEAAVAANPDDVEAAAKSLIVRFGIAQYELRGGDPRAAVARLARIDGDAQSLSVRAPERLDLRRVRAVAQDLQAVAFDDLGRPADAVASARASVASWRELSGSFPAHRDFRASLAHALGNCAGLLPETDAAEIDAMMREGVSIYEELCQDRPPSVAHRRGLAVALLVRGGRLAAASDAGTERQGLALLERGRDVVAELAVEKPDNMDCARLLVQAHTRVGMAQQGAGAPELARQSFVAAVAAAAVMVARRPESAEAVDVHVEAQLALAHLDTQAGDMPAALATADAVLTTVRGIVARDGERAGPRRQLLDALGVRGIAALALGQSDAVRAAHSEARAVARSADDLYQVAGAAASATRNVGGDDGAWFRREAVAALRAAVQAGFADRARLERDARFAGVRGDPEFAAVVATLGR